MTFNVFLSCCTRFLEHCCPVQLLYLAYVLSATYSEQRINETKRNLNDQGKRSGSMPNVDRTKIVVLGAAQ